MEEKVWDVAIIGSGPAGLTAAVYTSRGAASTLILGGTQWGGQLMLTTDVENFPGFSQGIQGPELMAEMKKQAERFGAKIVSQNATAVDFSQKPFQLKSSAETFLSRSVIITTGAETKWLGVPGEDKFRGRGISSCAPCDAPLFKDKNVAVIGGGDSALEEALVLTKYASGVTIIHRRDKFRASAAMQAKIKGSPKIKILWSSEVVEFLGQEKLNKIKLKNNQDNSVQEIAFDGAFVAIGHVPATEIFKGHLELDEKGYLKRFVNEYQMATSVPGVFVAGDVHDYRYRQAVTAAGFGCMAALDCLHFLEKGLTNNL